MSDPNLNDLPPIPPTNDPSGAPTTGPAPDLSAFDAGGNDLALNAGLAPIGSDDDALKKIGKRSSLFGKIVAGSIVLLVITLGIFWWRQSVAASHRWEAYNEAQENSENAEQFLATIRGILPETDYEDVKIRILEKMAEYEDAASVPVIVGELDAEQATVRAQAARTLAIIGSPGADPARQALLEMLPNTDERDRAPVVWALAVLGESAAAEEIIEEFASGRLQGQPNFDPRVISNVLGPQRLSSNELLNHEEVSVRLLTAQALAEIASPEVIDPLGRMVEFELARSGEGENEGPDENVLRAVASGLGRAGDPRAGQPLFRILTSQPGMRSAVIDSLRKTVGAPGIASLLESAEDVSVRRELVRILADSHDPRAADPLATHVSSDDDDIQQTAAIGLAELGDARATEPLIALVTHEDVSVARDALTRLQHMGSEQAAEPLMELLSDRTAAPCAAEGNNTMRYINRRASILRALGTTGVSEAGPAIERCMGTDDVASAAAALADLQYDRAYTNMLRSIPRPGDTDFSSPSVANEEAFMNRTAAVRALGRYGRPEPAEDLMSIIEDPLDDRRLRLDAGMALGAIADEEVLRTVLEKVQDEELDEVARRYYMTALWQNPSQSLVGDLMNLAGNAQTPPDVRRAAALAIGYAADPSVDARVGEMLSNPATRREAAFMIVLGGNEANARALVAAIGENEELRQVIQYSITEDQSNAFNLVTERSFESGQIFRRLRVARILREGEGDNRFGQVWNHLIERLRAGWGGHDGMTPREIREQLWQALRGDDEGIRELVASTFAGMNERGLLMAARDQGGPGSEEARDALRRLNTPPRS